MTRLTLDERIARHCEHAMASGSLDEELGTLHGIAWTQFVLLHLLDTAGGDMPMSEIATRLGLSRSRLIIQLLPMEKLGLVRREIGTGDRSERRIALGAAGHRLVREARETASAACMAMDPA